MIILRKRHLVKGYKPMYVCVSMGAKTFILSDDSINSYGFRTLTAGIDIEQFSKNPIMLFMHSRPWRGIDDEYTVIGRWENIRKEKGQLLADAVFDEKDPFAKKIADKVANNFLRMASLGFNPIETSSAEEHLLPGQRYETITKCFAKEASIVDIGANSNALALCDVPALYDEHDAIIKLTAGENPLIPTLKNKNDDMLQLKDVAVVLQLAETATTEQILEAVKKQSQEVVQLKADNVKVTGELVELKAAAVTEKITSLVQKAADDKKITDAEKPHYIKLATADFETTNTVLAGMKPYQSIETTLSDEGAVNQVELASLITLSGDQLFEDGKLDRLKELSPVHYKLKYKEAFGVEPEAEKK
jgi:hypothetical protein